MDSDIIFNQHNESLRLSRIPLYNSSENILLVSNDGGKFIAPKFIFNFLSCFAFAESDTIYAPIQSKSLYSICQALNLKKVDEISTEDLELLGIVSKSFSKISLSSSSKQSETISEEVFEDPNSKEPEIFSGGSYGSIERQEKMEAEGKQQSVCEVNDIINRREHITEDSDIKLEVSTKNKVDSAETCEINSGNVQRRGIPKRYFGDPRVECKIINGKKEIKSMICQICGKVLERTDFTRKGHANLVIQHQRHYKTHKNHTESCGCNITFRSVLEKLRHIKIVHKSFIQCSKCKRVLSNQESLEAHMKFMHEEKKCDICDYISEDKHRFEYHQKRHQRESILVAKEPSSQETFSIHKCPDSECDKTFTDTKRLNQHYRSHVKAECPECQKMMAIKFLKTHIDNIHKKEKKYWCDKCGKGFVERYKFELHESVEHQGQRYRCRYPECQDSGQQYRDLSNRLAHERKKHGATFSKFISENKLLALKYIRP